MKINLTDQLTYDDVMAISKAEEDLKKGKTKRLDNLVGIIPNTGDSVTKIKKLRKRLPRKKLT